MHFKRLVAAGIVAALGITISIGAYANTNMENFEKDNTITAGVTTFVADAEAQEVLVDHAQIYKTAQEGYYFQKYIDEAKRQLDEIKAQYEAERISVEGDSKLIHIPTTSYTVVTSLIEVPNPELAPFEQPSEEKPATVLDVLELPQEVTYKGLKTYMDYRTITATASPQYALEHISDDYYEYMNNPEISAEEKAFKPLPDKHIYTDEKGFRRIHCQNPYDSEYQERYVIALGSGITSKIGQYVDLILENGEVIPCVLGDQKADAHTDLSNKMTSIHNPNNACASEFIVEQDKIPANMVANGDSSYALNLVGVKVEDVRVYNKNVLK